MEKFKLILMGILAIIIYAYLFVLISKLSKMMAVIMYVIVGVFISAMIAMMIWYPDTLKLIVDFLNLGMI